MRNEKYCRYLGNSLYIERKGVELGLVEHHNNYVAPLTS